MFSDQLVISSVMIRMITRESPILGMEHHLSDIMMMLMALLIIYFLVLFWCFWSFTRTVVTVSKLDKHYTFKRFVYFAPVSLVVALSILVDVFLSNIHYGLKSSAGTFIVSLFLLITFSWYVYMVMVTVVMVTVVMVIII